MSLVHARLTGALVLALALGFAGAATAAEPLSRTAQRVYDDYRSDGAIDPCDHTAAAYRRTLEEITPDIEEETPAFRPAVEAAKQEREEGKKCKGAEEPASKPAPATPPGGGSSPGSAGGVSPAQPAPAQPAPDPAPSGSAPAPSGADAPLQSDAAPSATPAPAAPPTAAPPPAAETRPVLLSRPHEGTPVGLLIAAALLGLALLAALAALALRRLGWGGERLAGMRHAWGEAAYRASGTWADFVDWVRLGR